MEGIMGQGWAIRQIVTVDDFGWNDANVTPVHIEFLIHGIRSASHCDH